MAYSVPAFHRTLGLPLGLFLFKLAWYVFLVWELYVKIIHILECSVSVILLLNKQQAHACVCKICFILVLFSYLWKQGILTFNCYRILDDVDLLSGTA